MLKGVGMGTAMRLCLCLALWVCTPLALAEEADTPGIDAPEIWAFEKQGYLRSIDVAGMALEVRDFMAAHMRRAGYRQLSPADRASDPVSTDATRLRRDIQRLFQRGGQFTPADLDRMVARVQRRMAQGSGSSGGATFLGCQTRPAPLAQEGFVLTAPPRAGSLGARLAFQPGDRVVAVDGQTYGRVHGVYLADLAVKWGRRDGRLITLRVVRKGKEELWKLFFGLGPSKAEGRSGGLR